MTIVDDRARQIIERIQSGESQTLIGASFGISRERVRQIAKTHGVFTLVHEKARLRAAQRAADKSAKAAAKQERGDRLAYARRLVEDEGMSIRRAFIAVGLGHLKQDYYGHGWRSKHGRWRPELPALRQRAAEMIMSGATYAAASAETGLCWAAIKRELEKAGLIAPQRPKRPKPVRIRATGEVKRYRSDALTLIASDEWPEDKVRILLDGWSSGKSGAQIARELGAPYTRNSVLGKIFRLRRSGREIAA